MSQPIEMSPGVFLWSLPRPSVTPNGDEGESIQEGLGPASNVPLPLKQPGPTAAWDRQPLGGKSWRQGSQLCVEGTKLSPYSRAKGGCPVAFPRSWEKPVSPHKIVARDTLSCSVPLQLTSFSSFSGSAALSMTLSFLRMRMTLWSWKSEVSNCLALMPYSRVCLDMARFFSSCKGRKGQERSYLREISETQAITRNTTWHVMTDNFPMAAPWVPHGMTRVFTEKAPPE